MAGDAISRIDWHILGRNQGMFALAAIEAKEQCMRGLKIADLKNYPSIVLYWFLGFIQNSEGNWMVQMVFLDEEKNTFKRVDLSIGLLPVLTLGRRFCEGIQQTLPAKGQSGKFKIGDLSSAVEVTSAAIPTHLYFDQKSTVGTQKLFKLKNKDRTLLIPAVELIRFLLLHNTTMANKLMSPGAINLLFTPQEPGYQHEMHIDFSEDLPKSCLSKIFLQEFAWTALSPTGRRAWDSVYIKSKGKPFVSFEPPEILNTTMKYRCVTDGETDLVLEILEYGGKLHPCKELTCSHPLLLQPEKEKGTETIPSNSGLDVQDDSQEPTVKFRYETTIEASGVQGSKPQGLVANFQRHSSFKTKSNVKLIRKKKTVSSSKDKKSKPDVVEVIKLITVSADEKGSRKKMLELQLRLQELSMSWERLGDLVALVETVIEMDKRSSDLTCMISPYELIGGRAFSMANRQPRIALIVGITSTHGDNIILIDVERTGEKALAILAIHLKPGYLVGSAEHIIKKILDSLVENGGHWNWDVINSFSTECTVERLPRILSPRTLENIAISTGVWAVKLRDRLRLDYAGAVAA